ncbi:DUF4382 domain-containing protein [Maribrevibacterium harenarium]|uniref:DUF4382 domain-containing protein n=1 Tax=Maribrevibacterium harenarium TaxID=2589817 RepID=A0A501WYK8_9GAMM|nr:DUF5666 domain-containing protein [Maribrevibacterium harenarium]TPE53365.1 DUF4382 domain-containing protein [Maribrevibacterium harenarium]
MSKYLLRAKWLKAHWALLPLTYTLVACNPNSTSDSTTSPSAYQEDSAEVAEQDSDADDSKEGIVSLAITDNLSTDYAEVWVSVKEIDVKTGGDSQTLYKNSTGLAVNLSELTDVSQVLSQSSLPVGTYTDFSVTLGTDVVLVDGNGVVTNAKLSNSQTDVEWPVNGTLAVASGAVSQLSLDFNLAQFSYDANTKLVTGVISQLADSEYRAPYAHMTGTLSAVNGSQLTITPFNNAVPLTVNTDTATRIYNGHALSSLDQLVVGDQVEFYGQYNADQNTILAYKIETDTRYVLTGEVSSDTERGKVEGIIQSVDGETLTLDLKQSDRLPTQNSITISNVLNANYKTGSSSALAANQSIEVRGMWTTTGFSASLIEIEGASDSDREHQYQDSYVELKGVISDLGTDQATLTIADVEHSQTYTIGQTVSLDLSQAWFENADKTCLTDGAYVEAKGAATDTGLQVNRLEIKAACLGQNGVSQLHDESENDDGSGDDYDTESDHDRYVLNDVSNDNDSRAEVEGIVQSINGTTLTMTVRKYEHMTLAQNTVTVNVSSAWYDDGPASNLAVGRYIEVKGTWDGSSMSARKVSF